MTRTIIGTHGVRDVALDVERLVASRMLVQANSGGGKSWAIRRLLEQTHGAVQQLVIDVDGEYSTLRERFEYVLGARVIGEKTGADVVLDPKTAKVLAHRLLELNASAILDIQDLKPHDRIRFVRVFLEALVESPRELWHPCLVVIDEAHVFCPQRGEAESAAAVIDLMTRGRKRGFAGVLATQRLSKLHKDAAAEANVKLIGRSSLDVDMTRAAEELGFTERDRKSSLRMLKPGEFYAFGPGLSDVVIDVKIGPVQTTHVRAGARAQAAPPAPAKVKAILAQLGDLAKQADEEAKTIDQLRARVRELERAAKAPAVDPQRVKDLEAEVKEANARSARMSARATEWHEIAKKGKHELENALDNQARRIAKLEAEYDVELDSRLRTPREQIRDLDAKRGNGSGRVVIDLPPVTMNRRARYKAIEERGDLPPVDGLSPAKQRILNAIAYLAAIGVDRPDRAQVAFFAGTTPSSSSYQNNLGALRTSGAIDYGGSGTVFLTDLGAASADAGTLGASETQEHVQRALLERLPPAKQRIVRALLLAYPGTLSRAELAEQSETTASSSSFQNNLGSLRSLGAIEYRGKEVAASGLLFLEGAK